jgi:hypothetical protein
LKNYCPHQELKAPTKLLNGQKHQQETHAAMPKSETLGRVSRAERAHMPITPQQ